MLLTIFDFKPNDLPYKVSSFTVLTIVNNF